MWADCLLKHFGIPLNTLIDSSSSSSSSSIISISNGTANDGGNDGVVLVTIGGGHYVPKMNDAVSCLRSSFISFFPSTIYLCCMADIYFILGDFVIEIFWKR